jgi:hypothetical protein
MQNLQWPADKVERVPVADLVPYARNARTHSPEQVDQIAASIKEWGWTVPVLVDETRQLIAGHGRVLAAQKLGIETVPVMTANGWSDAQKRAYVLADNKLALNAGWDYSLLAIEVGDIAAEGFDLGLTGFSGAETAQLGSDGKGTNPETEWVDMPEFNQVDKTAHRSIQINFANDADAEKFAALVGQTITEKTRSIWFPEAVIERYADKRYA